ncbi:MAG TPA: protein phosphatase 2C domain-containing protein [Candidatus Sulfotelmatobacter sp.]|nr:protein phosphatase 2C domain-containing protein [Candidatus Sulfotelmatobacter sp.]
MLDLEFAELSDVGRVRARNEDYVGHVVPGSPARARSHGWLFALADGVGGQRQGEVASRAAVQEVVGGFERAKETALQKELLNQLVKAANARVCETGALAGPSGAGMASTIVVCGVRFDRATIAYVGDSRCYLIRNDHAQPITHDHTVAAEQARMGLLSAEEAAEASTRHLLSRSLGGNLFVSVEINEVQLLAEDVLLQCSDGLHGAVSAPEMAQTVGRHRDLNAAARELVASANEKDGGDNISVQLIRILSVERMGMYRGRPYKLR